MVDEGLFVSPLFRADDGLTLFLAVKRNLLVRARYDDLAVRGGSQAVKKAIERKKKKIDQNAKKSRPLAAGQPEVVGGPGDHERSSSSRAAGERFGKRRRVE